jgi:D-3-phosphoglycerate dehydrogenase
VKIYILDWIHPAGVDLLRESADIVTWADPETGNWPLDADALIVRTSKLGREALASAKRVKVIAKHGVGYENIDVDAAREFGIVVCNNPGVNSQAVAEMAFTLGLCVSRRVMDLDRALLTTGVLDRSQFIGPGAAGKTVGVVGMGNIGTQVARMWHGAFDSRLLAYDPYAPDAAWGELPHVRVDGLDELLRRSDIVTLHLPLTADNVGMIGAGAFGQMKPTAIFVNTSRGGLVDEDALYDALVSGRIFGAGLDVFQDEPVTRANRLVGLDRVIATPHAAGGTESNQRASSLAAARSALDVLGGREPAHRIP